MDLCRNLQLICIVEGVESHEHVIILQSLGCRRMQGYFFGDPMPAESVSDFTRLPFSEARPTPRVA